MTDNATLEEIEAEIAKLGDQRWYGKAHTLRLLEICREQAARIKDLERAIVAANDGVTMNEGVNLVYYMDYPSNIECHAKTIENVIGTKK